MGSSSSKSSSEIHADSKGVSGKPNILSFATFYSRASDDEFYWFGYWVLRDSGGYHEWYNALNSSGMLGQYIARLDDILDARGEYNWIEQQYGNQSSVKMSNVKSSSVQVSTVQSSPAVVCTSEVVIVTPVTSTIGTTKTTSSKKTTRKR